MTKTLLLLAVIAVPALGADPLTVYAFCDNQPKVDGPRVRQLSVKVTRTAASLELVDVKVKGARAQQEEKTGLPTSWLGRFDGASCSEAAVDVEITVRDGKARKLRTLTVRSPVQQVQ